MSWRPEEHGESCEDSRQLAPRRCASALLAHRMAARQLVVIRHGLPIL